MRFLAERWHHLLDPERILWLFQKTLWGKEGKKPRETKLSREAVCALGSKRMEDSVIEP